MNPTKNPPATESPAQPVRPHMAYPHGRWTLIRNALTRRSAARPGGLVQGELSLDAIKVVRNDLSDADVVVMPAAASSEPAAGPPEGTAEPASSGALLGRLTSRWLGAGKM